MVDMDRWDKVDAFGRAYKCECDYSYVCSGCQTLIEKERVEQESRDQGERNEQRLAQMEADIATIKSAVEDILERLKHRGT